MKRCWGRTKSLNRCGRIGDWRFFCHEHKKQPIIWLFVLIFTVIAGTASILSYLSKSPSTLTQGIKDNGTEKTSDANYSGSGTDIASTSATSSYRVRYIQLNDSKSFNALLNGRLKEEYPEVFDKEPFVIRSEVFNLLERLRSEIAKYGGVLFSQTFDFARIKDNFESDPNYFISNPHYSRFADNECPSHVDYAIGFVGSKNINHLAGRYRPFSTIFQKLLTTLETKFVYIGHCQH
jgi:hypothetical protein